MLFLHVVLYVAHFFLLALYFSRRHIHLHLTTLITPSYRTVDRGQCTSQYTPYPSTQPPSVGTPPNPYHQPTKNISSGSLRRQRKVVHRPITKLLNTVFHMLSDNIVMDQHQMVPCCIIHTPLSSYVSYTE